MSSQTISGMPVEHEPATDNGASEVRLDDKINSLRETVLQLLQEVESLTIAVPRHLRGGTRLDEEVRQFEVNLIRTALGRTAGSQTRAAKLLGLKLTTLNAKIKRYHIAPAGYQAQLINRSEPHESAA
jgi:DNA-binding NtrC family response regulator